jgi:hypothetical protein
MHTLLLSYSATFLELKALLTYTSDPIALIVECFAAAKSNCVLMAERLTMEDRLGISEIVINHREKLKILLAAATCCRCERYDV